MDLIKTWLDLEHNVKVFEIKSKQVYIVVCEACSCPRGDKITALVDLKDKEKMLALDWEVIVVGRTEEAKQYPDGSAAGRIYLFCDFEECT